MSYLDYLPTHRYGALPPEIQEQISETEYDRCRQLTGRLARPSDELPPELSAAYRTTIARRRQPTQIPRWVLAASWLLTLAVGGAWLAQEPTTHYVQLPPEIRTQTVTEIRTDTVERLVYRTRFRTDTVLAPASAPEPQIVVVRDTVYREAAEVLPPFRSVAVTPAILSLLVSSTTE